jgi:hypothetical protein
MVEVDLDELTPEMSARKWRVEREVVEIPPRQGASSVYPTNKKASRVPINARASRAHLSERKSSVFTDATPGSRPTEGLSV